MANIVNGSGSFNLGQTFLASQLASESPRTSELSYSSSEESVISLDNPDTQGLAQLHDFKVNGKSLNRDPSYASKSESEKAQTVFQSLEAHLGSTSAAASATRLASQELREKVITGVAFHKGMSFVAENGRIKKKYGFSHIKTTAELKTNGNKTFKLTNKETICFVEKDHKIPGQLYQDDLSQIGYFKVKTVVKGPIEALANANANEMTIKTSFTKSHQVRHKAEKAHFSILEKNPSFTIPEMPSYLQSKNADPEV